MFVVLRGLMYACAFVALWAWLALSVQRLDVLIGLTVPVWLRPVGWVLASAGAVLAVLCIATFVTRGRGTPAPFDPPRVFVASGPYRYVRNPMYVGAFAVLLGAGFAFSSPSIVLLGVVFLAIAHAFVVLYEEPALTHRFGDTYTEYRSSVRRWLIRSPSPSLTRDLTSPWLENR